MSARSPHDDAQLQHVAGSVRATMAWLVVLGVALFVAVLTLMSRAPRQTRSSDGEHPVGAKGSDAASLAVDTGTGPRFLDADAGTWARRLLDADPATSRDAAERLIEGGGPAAWVLVELLSSDDQELRELAGDLLARIGGASVPALRSRARDPSPVCRYHVVSTLGDLGPDATVAIDTLIAALEDEEVHVAREAGWALAALRERGAPAVPALVRLLDHHDPLARIYAGGALAAIGPTAAPAVPRLILALDDVDAGVRRCAAEALAAIGPEAAGAVEALARRLEDRNLYVRLCAIGALGAIGEPARRFEPSLHAALERPAEAREAAWALSRITGVKVEAPRPPPPSAQTEPEVVDVDPPIAEWSMLGRTSARNAVVPSRDLPSTWRIDGGENVLWSVAIGDDCYASPVVAGGKVLVGADNALALDPTIVGARGVLLALDASSGELLWMDTAAPLGRGLDEFLLPITTSSPLVEGERLWYVTAQCQLRCLDLEGFADGENDGPRRDEPRAGPRDADLVWELDMGGRLGVFPHESSNCSVAAVGDILLVCTSNGVDEAHTNVPAPRAPSFIGVDKRTGHVEWTAIGPGTAVLHGQWSSPAVVTVSERPLAVFGGGDGVAYALEAATGHEIWRFDGNPPEAVWRPSGDVDGIVFRNSIVACPVVHDGTVYVAMGQDPEHGVGRGALHAIDPGGRGDVTTSRRVWTNRDVGRSIATPVVTQGLVFTGDLTGFVHCIDAETGATLWTHDLFAAVWGSMVAIGDRLFVGDEDGTVTVFRVARQREILARSELDSRITASPAVTESVLYYATSRRLWAIGRP